MEPNEMAVLLASIVNGTWDDDKDDYIGRISTTKPTSNTFVVEDQNTGRQYLCTVKKVSK